MSAIDRCPECGNFVHFSFMDDLRGLPIYKCTTYGVPIIEAKTKRQTGSTLDHSDYYFMEGWRVTPQQVGKNLWTVKADHLPDLVGEHRAELAARDFTFVLANLPMLLALRLRQLLTKTFAAPARGI